MGSNYDAASSCSGGNAFMCYDYAPWAVSPTLAYGFAAVNPAMISCGKCYQLQFDGGSHNGSTDGTSTLTTKTMIVQTINTGRVEMNQFDILVPGGGVGDFDACTSQWGTSNIGERYGGIFLSCQRSSGDYSSLKTCASNWCQELFGSRPDLLDGCNWFVDWFGVADNPTLIYKEIACPDAIKAVSGMG